VGSCRRELLDHIIALKGAHLRRLLSESFLIIMTTGLILACQRNAWPQNPLGGDRTSGRLIHNWAVAPSLRARGLISANSPWLTPYEARSEHLH
jgi:hypothetical protein